MIPSLLLTAAALTSPVLPSTAKVDKTLNEFHQAAAEAKFDEYFSHFAKDGIFIGTDASERWTVETFKAYVAPFFSKGKGWKYTPKIRHISFSPDQKIAWFDEILESASYGTSRGTGVLVLEKADWKISQYQLGFPIPNELAGKFTEEIKAYEAQPKKSSKANP